MVRSRNPSQCIF